MTSLHHHSHRLLAFVQLSASLGPLATCHAEHQLLKKDGHHASTRAQGAS